MTDTFAKGIIKEYLCTKGAQYIFIMIQTSLYSN